jgi:hypothetical protein
MVNKRGRGGGPHNSFFYHNPLVCGPPPLPLLPLTAAVITSEEGLFLLSILPNRDHVIIPSPPTVDNKRVT